jgi:MFS family permease
VGGGIAMMLGAHLLAKFTAGGPYDIPLLDTAQPWRVVFLILAVPGLLVALLVQATVRDEGSAASRIAAAPAKGEAMAFVKANRTLMALLATSIVSWSMNNYGLLNWYPAMLMRSYEMTPALVATSYGPAFLLGGVAGCLAIHPYHAWLRRRFGHKAAYYLTFSSMAVLSVTTILGPIVPTVGLAVFMSYANLFVSSMSVASIFVLIVAVVPPTLRGLFTGLYMALVNLTGGAFGSVLVGMMTDHVYGANGLNLALTTMAVVFGPLGALLMWLAIRKVPAPMQ